jgi:hypothetical protein
MLDRNSSLAGDSQGCRVAWWGRTKSWEGGYFHAHSKERTSRPPVPQCPVAKGVFTDLRGNEGQCLVQHGLSAARLPLCRLELSTTAHSPLYNSPLYAGGCVSSDGDTAHGGDNCGAPEVLECELGTGTRRGRCLPPPSPCCSWAPGSVYFQTWRYWAFSIHGTLSISVIFSWQPLVKRNI